MTNVDEFRSLRFVSLKARGVWVDIRLITEAHGVDGYLPISPDRLAVVAGTERSELDVLLGELATCGLLVVSGDRVYSAMLETKVALRNPARRVGGYLDLCAPKT